MGWLLFSLVAVVAMGLLIRLVRTPPPAPPVGTEPPPLQGTPPDPSWLSRPRPGDVWRTSTGDCLVLRTYSATVDVIEAGTDAQVRLLPDSALTERVGQADPAAWAEIQRQHRTGYAA